MGSYYKNYFILLILSVNLGSSFILMKRGLEEYTDIQVAALRLFIAFLSLVPFLYTSFKETEKKIHYSSIYYWCNWEWDSSFLIYKSTNHIRKFFCRYFKFINSYFHLIFRIYFFKTKPSTLNIAGVLLGFLG